MSKKSSPAEPQKPQKIMLGSKVREQLAARIMSINTFIDGVRTALNVPRDWLPLNDAQGAIQGFQSPPEPKTKE